MSDPRATRLRCPRVAALVVCIICIATSVAQAAPREIRTGLFVTSLSAIDARDGSFRIAGYLWFTDPAGSFDPGRDFEIIARSATSRVFAQETLPGGGSYTAVRFDAVVDQRFDVHAYPFDSQVLSLALESARDTEILAFVPDIADSRIADWVRAPGWQIERLGLSVTEQDYDTGFGYRDTRPSFSRLKADIAISRTLSPILFEKFTGFFVAFAITAMVLFVPAAEIGTRVGMTTGSVFAAVFNRYRLEDAIGFDAVFGIADQVSLLTFSAILQILVLSLVTHRLGITRGPVAARSVNLIGGGTIILVHAALIALAFAAAIR